MSPAIDLETLAVAVIVAAFALRALFQLFPAASRRTMTRLRAALGIAAPAAASVAAGDCNSGCGSCNSCGSGSPQTPAAEAPIAFRPRTPKA